VFEILKEVQLNALEYAAVYGLRITEEKAAELKSLSQKYDVALSMHAAYYISLLSKDPKIRDRSKARLVKALQFAPKMGVNRIVFHPGGYSGQELNEAFEIVRNSIQQVQESVDKESKRVLMAPETSGKHSAFGSVDEILKLCIELDNVIPTIDWAHIYAKSSGQSDKKESYIQVLTLFEDELGPEFIENMHFHASGIVYTDKGEQSHCPLGLDWGPNLVPLMEIVTEVGYRPTFISETPNPIEGALYMKFLLEEVEKTQK
jgi:deoxyribonuclease-4